MPCIVSFAMGCSTNPGKLRPAWFTCWFVAATVWGCLTSFGQYRQIEVEVVVDRRAPVETSQQWAEMLNTAQANRVIVKVGNLGQPSVDQTRLNQTEWIKVRGFVDRNRLLLPGESFALNDGVKIRQYIQRLRDDGVAVGLAEKHAFGLTGPQLVELHNLLSEPIRFQTKDLPVGQALEKISQILNTVFEVDTTADLALAGDSTILEELEGFSLGTAIAIIVRPLGLVFQPERLQGQPLKLLLVDSRETKEHWPIGWPIEEVPVNAEPRLFERLDLEIRGFPLKTTLDAIEKRTRVPFVYDQNSLARSGIELMETKVTLVQQKTTYISAINKLLGQTKPRLKSELRKDEAGKTFLWIAPIQ
jgi:hypothetical protein